MRLDGKVAIITGGSSGIGKAASLALAKAGAQVVIAARNEERLIAVKELITAEGGKVTCIPTDIGKESLIKHLVEETVRQHGHIDILVNNAAISPIVKRPEKITLEEWESIINVDLTGPFLCAQAIGREMIRQRSGSIINITSVTLSLPIPGLLAYSVAKAGVEFMTRQLAVEWAEYNIRVNSVSPGWTKTPMLELALKGGEEGNFYKWGMSRIPMKRFGEPEELANAIVFLASDAASYITGAIIPVDGGYSA